MNIAFYSGAAGMMAYQSDMDIIAHNIANVNTTGYKPQRGVFADLLYSRMAVNTEQELLTGHGVRLADSDLLFRQGPINPTGLALDFAIIGNGCFAVELTGEAEGGIAYTRKGEFAIGLEDGTEGFLVTVEGHFVLDADGERIELSEQENTDTGYDLSDLMERIGVYHIPNPYGMEPMGDGLYRLTQRSGEAVAMEEGDDDTPPYRLVQHALERSAVELADEMVLVIQSQRAFQMSARLVQTADELEDIVNNLR
jgi:flagellar basal-body rod protein FlgG